MINKWKYTGWLLLYFVFCVQWCPAEMIQRFTLQNGSVPFRKQPLSINIDGFVSQSQMDNLIVYEVRGDSKTPLISQVCGGDSIRLWFMPSQTIAVGETLILELHNEDCTYNNLVKVQKNKQAFTLSWDGLTILSYYHALHPVPEGIDPVFRRSGFIHPLYSPSGRILTRIQPPDHYHHYGIWNPWTKTRIEGKEVDFWNLKKKQGTVRFAKLLSTVSGPVLGNLRVLQEHVQFLPNGDERVVINEIWDVSVYPALVESYTWIVDLTCSLYNTLSVPIELNQYRYGGGLGFRATEQWNKDNCTVLTSEGKTRHEADGTRARWCDIRGGFNDTDATSGILFLSHTANREHPEPMRVWSEDAVGNKGEIFFEFCPVRLNSWILKPEKEYVLRYRMVVYDGKLHPKAREVLWNNYTDPPIITRKKR